MSRGLKSFILCLLLLSLVLLVRATEYEAESDAESETERRGGFRPAAPRNPVRRPPMQRAIPRPAAPIYRAQPIRRPAAPIHRAQPIRRPSTPIRRPSAPIHRAQPIRRPAAPIRRPSAPIRRPSAPIHRAQPIRRPAAPRPIHKAQPIRRPVLNRGGKKPNPAKPNPVKPVAVAPPAAVAYSRPRTLDDRSIWNKYRARLAYEVAKRFCGGQTECDYVRKTEFQLITTSMTANWNNDKNQLNKDVVGFAPAWEVAYKPVSTSQDGIFSELYKKYLLASKNIKQFKAFMGVQPERNNIFYNWEETHSTLRDFIQDFSSKPSTHVGFSFNINLSTSESLKNSWATLGGGYNGEKGFIRTFTKENVPLADLEGHFDSASDSEFIFGRDRTVYHHVYQTKTVVIKTNKFDFNMNSVGLGAINVKPAGDWFNKAEFIADVEGRAAAGFLGPHSKMPLLPASIIVAYKPKVEIVVSKSVYDEIQASVKNTQVLGWLVGGARFRAPQIKALNDDGSVEHYSNEEIATGKATADEILFEKIESAAKQTRNFEASDLENHFDDSSRYAQLAEFNTENPSSDSQWLFRRRRTHHRTVVHVVEKKVEEGNYKITWVSHSDVPQILGVISERL